MCHIFSPASFAAAIHFASKSSSLRENARTGVPQGHYNRAGQRRGIHQMRAAQLLRIGNGIGQDQPALGVGIEDFDGLAGKRFHDVARALCLGCRACFPPPERCPSRRLDGFSRAMACMAPITAAPPAMSYFIFSMPSEGLMEMPPVSNVTPLPISPRWPSAVAFSGL